MNTVSEAIDGVLDTIPEDATETEKVGYGLYLEISAVLNLVPMRFRDWQEARDSVGDL